jgi:hypothetical protein
MYFKVRIYVVQIPETKVGEDKIDAVVVDEDAVGTAERPGCGAKILRGDGALDQYLKDTKSKDQVVCIFIVLFFLTLVSYRKTRKLR